ncbi:low temperature requirement protein A [Micromonospora deserti]|uniref:Low temperature requirement protein A n=1 Tax=Micromonospora deserti TaxID=2070366 RepID=A0A2W2CVK7_9ACTN|nr:low temperature requirement protein A [Micromonospora deserti]PZG02553.1 low temperature requirement protein A [Micromonospora deserti]
MTTGQAEDLLRDPDRPHRATYVELLFDVVFVFAVVRLSDTLFSDLTWAGAWQVGLMLAAFWWIWIFTTWTSGRLDADRASVQFLIVMIMLAGLLMVLAVPEAFGQQSVLFAAMYVAIQVGRGLFVLVALPSQRAALGAGRMLVWSCASGVFWLAGAVLGGTPQLVLWSLGLIVDASHEFRLPSYHAHGKGLTASASHLAERFHQFMIIAIADKILAAGLKFNQLDFVAERVAALVITFWTAILTWRIYFYHAGELLPASIASSRSPGRYSRSLAYWHLVMVAGLVVNSASEEVIVTNPTGQTRTVWAVVIAGGLILFLIGRAGFDKLTFNRVAGSRIVGLLLIATVTPLAMPLDPMLITLIMNVILAGVAISDTVFWRRRPRRPSPPG